MPDDILRGLPDFAPGTVWLTGAGPGPAHMVTLMALHGLRHADVVVHDALVGPDVLSLARPGAAIEFAGKRGGKPSPNQADISLALIRHARAGRRVLRLKGGDPFVFGRGGEEALALVRAGVPFRVVPGVSSGIGGLAYAGIPVTHRDINSAVAFITGHDLSGAVPDAIDWPALARAAPVLVFYMALKHLETIAHRLIAAGRRPDEPVAVVSKAATSEQTVLEAQLATCAARATEANIAPPALVVVGQTVRLRAGLDWLGALDGRALDPDPLGTAADRELG